QTPTVVPRTSTLVIGPIAAGVPMSVALATFSHDWTIVCGSKLMNRTWKPRKPSTKSDTKGWLSNASVSNARTLCRPLKAWPQLSHGDDAFASFSSRLQAYIGSHCSWSLGCGAPHEPANGTS